MTQLHSFHAPARVVPVKDQDVSCVRPHDTGEGSFVFLRNGATLMVAERTDQIEISGLEAFASLRDDEPLTLVRLGHVSAAESYGDARTKLILRGGQHVIVSETVERMRDELLKARAS